MLRLGSLASPSPANKVVVPVFFVFLDLFYLHADTSAQTDIRLTPFVVVTWLRRRHLPYCHVSPVIPPGNELFLFIWLRLTVR